MSENKSNTSGANIVSVRLDNRVYTVIQTLAEEYDTTVSMVVRLALDQELEKFLGQVQVRYIDPNQADIINKNIIAIGTLLSDIRMQLRRIGCNVNGLARARNALLKQRINFEALKIITTNVPTITKEDIGKLLEKLEEVNEKVGDGLRL